MRIPTPYGWEYKTAVSPDGKWQVVYNCEHFLLMDTKGGVIKELDLGTERPGGKGLPRWAMDAQWSPDGQQLAIVSTFGDFLPRPTQLLILDPWGEKVRKIRHPLGIIFSEVDWAPGGKLLLVSGLEVISEGTFLPRMWLVDVKMESMRELASFPIARSEDPRGGAAWSPDGKHIIFYCRPKSASGPALCLASVEVGQ
jgi:dipeptidyl aminopeptidase/acylaminoacyl peptidase